MIKDGLVEALRNIVAAPFLFGALAIAVAMLSGGAITADLMTISRIVSSENSFIEAGGDLLRASPRENGEIDSARCAALADLNGVIAATAVSAHQVRLSGRPEHIQTVFSASPGIETIVGASALSESQLIASQIIAERWNWRDGTKVAMNLDTFFDILSASSGDPWQPPVGTQVVIATPDLSRLGDQASTAIIVPAPAIGTAAECIVQAEPHLIDTVEDTIPALLGEDDGSAIDVQRQVYVGEFGPDPAREFAGRPTRMVGLAGGAAAGVLLGFIAWTRRQRAALYSTLGMSYSGGVALRAAEMAYPALLGITWGTLWAALIGTELGLVPRVSVTTASLQGLAAAATTLAITVTVSLWKAPTLQALKDR